MCPFQNVCKRYLDCRKGEVAMESPFHPVERGRAAYCDHLINVNDKDKI